MKKIIKQLNRKLPQILKEKTKPGVPLTTIRMERQLTQFIPEKPAVKPQPQEEKVHRMELWTPSTVKTRGLTPALKWLMENLPEKPTPINILVEKAAEEYELERAAVETAIWRLIQQGVLYQPKPAEIQKL